jgi:hypothetical protein
VDNIRINPEEYHEEQGPVFDPDETYDAILTGFAEFSGEYGPGLVWRFKLTDEDGTEAEAAGFSSLSMADGDRPSKLITWTRKLLGEIPEGGVDLSDLEGKPCRVEITHYTKKDGAKDPNTGEPIIKMKVSDLKAPRKGKRSRSMQDVA